MKPPLIRFGIRGFNPKLGNLLYRGQADDRLLASAPTSDLHAPSLGQDHFRLHVTSTSTAS